MAGENSRLLLDVSELLILNMNLAAAAAIACSDSQVISHEVTSNSSGAKLDGCSLGEFHCSA